MDGFKFRLYSSILFIVYLKQVTNATLNFTLPVKLNHEARLQCKYQGDPYGVKVRWFNKKDGWLSEGTTVYKYQNQLKINKPALNEWNLHILRVSMSFQDTYTCMTAEGNILSYIKLVIETPPRIVEEESSPIRMKFSETSMVVLKCGATGIPEPEIKWYRGLSESETGITGHILIIRDVTRYAADEYICRAQNQNGEAERRIRIYVNFAPEVSIMEPEVYAAGGEVVVMSCAVSASPLYESYWTKGSDVNGKRIESDWKYIIKSEDGSDLMPVRFLTLIIKKSIVSVQDYGIYTCVAQGEGLVAHGFVYLRQRHQKMIGKHV